MSNVYIFGSKSRSLFRTISQIVDLGRNADAIRANDLLQAKQTISAMLQVLKRLKKAAAEDGGGMVLEITAEKIEESIRYDEMIISVIYQSEIYLASRSGSDLILSKEQIEILYSAEKILRGHINFFSRNVSEIYEIVTRGADENLSGFYRDILFGGSSIEFGVSREGLVRK